MYRDFSENSKKEILSLVSEVENEKWCDFTDWVGDRWLDFQYWIGKLNIKNYINNVNAYHKKVIDKNNATKKSIERIFRNVATVDSSYKKTFSFIEKQLCQCQRYINDLSKIVNSQNGIIIYRAYNFPLYPRPDHIPHPDHTKDYINYILGILFEFIIGNKNGVVNLFRFLTGDPSYSTNFSNSLTLKLLLNSMSRETSDNENIGKNFEKVFNSLSNINKNIGKYGKKDGVTLSSSVLSYLGTLCGIANHNSTSGVDVTSDILSLFKSSVGVETGIYKYYEKTLHPYEISKLDARFGNAMTGLSLAASLADTTKEGIETYKIFSDPNSTSYDKAAQSIEIGSSVFDSCGKFYIAKQASSKTLQFIISASGSKKAVNQILATEQKLKYTTSPAATKNIAKANTFLALANVTASTISGGVKRYGQVTADGKFDMGDAGSVGLHGSLSGLNCVTSSLTLGLVQFDSETVAADLENDADKFLQGDSWAAKYIRNQDNNIVLRFGVSVGSGGYLLGKKVVNGVADGAKTVGSWISTGWNTVTNLF